MAKKIDRELEEFRKIMEVPSTFEDGFRWSSLFGAIFIALLMVPGALYMNLLAGQGVGPAAQWVTVILFIEVARRAHKTLNKPEIFVLYFMAGAAMNMPFSGLLWQQYYVQSDPAIAAGVAEHLPRWFAPRPDSTSFAERTFFHPDWYLIIGMVVFQTFFGQISSLVLGYGLFRIASDIEKLPFPMAPVGAQGITALAEDIDAKSADPEKTWRWRVFAIGGALGLAFGSVYLLLPTLSGALTGTAIQLLPIPFTDLTPLTGKILPAVATGISWDLMNLVHGLVLPYFAMVGSLAGLIFTMVANPVLYKLNILSSWVEGDGTIPTLFKNNIDFYFSFTIGVGFSIALGGLWKVIKSVKGFKIKSAKQDAAVVRESKLPPARGDIKTWIVILCFFLITVTYITVSMTLLYWHHNWEWSQSLTNLLLMLLGLGFIYTPMISYITARLEGMVGQVVEIPMIREAAIILSGYRGVACWFLPLPIANYGMMTVFYRQCELTGTKFTSMWKTKLVLYPIILVASIFFMNFIWGLADVPSPVYPFANMMWELNAANASIMYSSTLGDYSIFEDAFRWSYLFSGVGFGVLLFMGMSWVGAPIFLTYGVVRGLGQTMPHSVVTQFIGALLGRYYFQKKMKLRWRQYTPVVSAGFACGMGLITTLGVGITFLKKAAVQVPL